MEFLFYVASFLVQLLYAGATLLSKIAMICGLNDFVFIFYRYLAGTIVLVPITFMFFKTNQNASFSWTKMGKTFGISLIGTIVTESFILTINYASTNFAAAASNCIPVTTFLFALLFGMEKVNIRTAGGIAKMVGLVASMAGAALLAFYQGHYFPSPFSHHFFAQLPHRPASSTTWILGCIFLLIAAFSSGIWFVLQARFLEEFPSPIVFTFLQSAMSTVQSLIIAVIMEREPSQWKLGWDLKLLSIVCCAIFIPALGNTLQCWVIKHKGAVFLAMTTPLILIATIVGSGILFSQGIYFGSILGAVFLIFSLYAVLWGKSKDEVNTQNTPKP